MAAASAASCLGPAAAAIQGQKLRQRSVRPGAGRGGGARQAPSAKAVAEAGPVARPNQAEWNSLGSVCAVLGSQWGDEGKGKLVDILAQEYDIVARCQGGANAGHTIYDDNGVKYALHLVPSGILNEKCLCLVGNGVVVHLPAMFEELDTLDKAGVKVDSTRLVVSDRAHMLFDLHKEVDGLREAELSGNKIGTTKRGIGPAYASKATRNGIRVGDLRNPEKFAVQLRALAADAAARFPGFEYDVEAEIVAYKTYAARIMPFITDTVHLVNEQHKAGKRVLVEGANATMLDLDFGTYPYVTSSNPSLGGVCAGLGLAPSKFQTVIGVAKAYTTRVGEGPYPTELFGDMADLLREKGFEYGTTTGRPRRIGWLDVVALNYATTINGFTHINLTKLDVLSGLDELKIGVAYKLPDGTVTTAFPSDIDLLGEVEVVYETIPGWAEDISGMRLYADLPANCKAYVERCEELCGVECRYLGVGPGRDAMVVKP
eukprot:CAMPEP_0181360742 /NCGR_PEP_ID=MMETSP1106-20121128/6843_1 /TAXON_ID=81844 /ORGANISM="Mantoniella antarctica, Strain SL-175" /LENGTH=487 /DNA_ID=CAMNT_0023474065 /DNA_START=106 /DNA_END=1569 /DNA_ORIENTATION=+